jgi:cbb3-type cytochrome oxidase subunit 3
MWLLIVEALIALGMFVFIVWWTMFAGRRKGELAQRDDKSDDLKG